MTPEAAPTSRREAVARLVRAGGLSAAAAGLGVWLKRRGGRAEEATPVQAARPDFTVAADARLPELAVVEGGEPAPMTRRAVAEMGGIARFVARGDVVVLKPNIAWDRTPAQAANTNPEVVAEMARLCREAGARRVIVADVPIEDARRTFARSGIAQAARAAGAEIVLPEDRLFRQVDLRGEVLHLWPVLEPFLEADKVLNLPVAKHHSLTGATLGIKNWYGILGGPRYQLHQHIHESLADLAAFLRPTLTVLDGYRVLVRNGPGGGNPADAELKRTILAATDPVALDAWAAKTWWDLDPGTVGYLKLASERNLGKLELEESRVRLVKV